jgi:hypothetical protein
VYSKAKVTWQRVEYLHCVKLKIEVDISDVAVNNHKQDELEAQMAYGRHSDGLWNMIMDDVKDEFRRKLSRVHA